MSECDFVCEHCEKEIVRAVCPHCGKECVDLFNLNVRLDMLEQELGNLKMQCCDSCKHYWSEVDEESGAEGMHYCERFICVGEDYHPGREFGCTLWESKEKK